jgi:hypothetical protein
MDKQKRNQNKFVDKDLLILINCCHLMPCFLFVCLYQTLLIYYRKHKSFVFQINLSFNVGCTFDIDFFKVS